MSSGVYAKLQEEVVSNDRLCTIEVETITPVLMGGYDSKCYHEALRECENLRVTEIKGLWRWWARALIAAAIAKTRGKYLTLDIADLFISKMLGSKNKVSKYAITVTPSKIEYEQIIRQHKSRSSQSKVIKYKESRVELLSMKKDIGDEYAIKPGALFKVVIYRTVDTEHEEDDFAIWSFVVALLFDGIGGKACSRGFGRVKIRRIEGTYVRELNSLLDGLYKPRTINEIKSKLEEIITGAVEKAEGVVRLYGIDQEVEKLNLLNDPLIELPILEKDLMIIEVTNKRFENLGDVLKAISYASLKQFTKH